MFTNHWHFLLVDMSTFKGLLFLLLATLASCEKFKFDNYTLYKIIPNNEAQVSVLRGLINNPELDFFEEPSRVDGLVSVVSSANFKSQFRQLLENNGIKAEVTIENIQESIEKQKVGRYTLRNIGSMAWDAYYPLNDIYSWLDDLASTYSDRVSTIIGGSSFEGREIRGIKISSSPGKRNIFIEGGIHSREWISPATVNYIISELLFSPNPEIIAAANDFDWYIFPVTNPDGYIWTFDGYRLWRKNRRPVGTEYGIDLNRNWNSNWLVTGASTNPASNTYAGTGPFSEPETRTLSEYIQSVAGNMDMYLSFHSSGQLMMLPYGNTTEPLDNYDDAMIIGTRAMEALSVRHVTIYTTGNIAEVIYEAAGSSVDWVKEKLRTPLVYCYELRDRGEFGHLLPADQILPNSEEVMDSVVALIREGRALGYFNGSSALHVSLLTLLLAAMSLFA